jgi:hypothetical protein
MPPQHVRYTNRHMSCYVDTLLRDFVFTSPTNWTMTVSDCKEWWPGTELNRRRQPFQDRLPNWPNGLESADVTGRQELILWAIWDGVGRFALFSLFRCSRMVRAKEARFKWRRKRIRTCAFPASMFARIAASQEPAARAFAVARLMGLRQGKMQGFDLPPKNSARENWSSPII